MKSGQLGWGKNVKRAHIQDVSTEREFLDLNYNCWG